MKPRTGSEQRCASATYSAFKPLRSLLLPFLVMMALAIIGSCLATFYLIKQQSQEILPLTLILLAVLLPLSAGVLHILLLPLIHLRKRAATVAEDLTGISLEDYRGHEIERLIHTFDDMATVIEEHGKARQKAEALLQQEHATLEVKVRERTREMVNANQLLQREIAERTRTQQKAEELQKFLASLIDAIPSLLIGIDPRGHINQWNKEAQNYCGLSFPQVSGLPFHEVFPWLNRYKTEVEQTLISGVKKKIPHLHWSSFRGEKLVDLAIFPLSANQPGGALIRIDDVTERTRLDELIMQTEKMMSIGSLAAGMAHEINNPLASIIQSAQVIIQRLSPDLPKNRNCADSLGTDLKRLNSYLNERQIHKMLNSILESGQQAGEIVKNMQSFSRGNDSGKSMQKISEILDRAIELASRDYDLKKRHNIQQINFIRNYQQDLPETLCIPSQLEQVFFNLIQNAAQALSSHKKLQSGPRITLSLELKKQMLSVDISDNGPGITIDNQSRIFEPFFTTKEVGQGTGLGLSVSYFIITENHGGQLSMTSKRSQGCCFHILLPVKQQPC